MCGRFTLTRSAAEVASHFEAELESFAAGPADPEDPAWAPRWNVAPGQPIAVVRAEAPGGGARRLGLRRWAWPSRAAGRPPLINARAESAARRPSFAEALRRRRCLVPADGFYEWSGGRGRRRPWHLTRPGGALFAMAGLRCDPEPTQTAPGGAAEGAAPRPGGAAVILTTEAQGDVRRLHDRMPLLVAPEAFGAWLDPAEEDGERALAIVRAHASGLHLAMRPVSRRVNDVAHEGPACLGPPEEPELPLA